jgi:hypothetical protein
VVTRWSCICGNSANTGSFVLLNYRSDYCFAGCGHPLSALVHLLLILLLWPPLNTTTHCCHCDCYWLLQVVHEEEEPYVFSFYQDMSQNPHVIKLMLTMNQAIHRVFSLVNKYLDGWRRYDTVYNLWNTKRKAALDKLAEKGHNCVYFDTRIASYELLAETVSTVCTLIYYYMHACM